MQRPVSVLRVRTVSPQLVIEIIHWLARQQKTLNFAWPLVDIAELNPNFDLDNRTAKLAARLIHEVVHAKQNSGC